MTSKKEAIPLRGTVTKLNPWNSGKGAFATLATEDGDVQIYGFGAVKFSVGDKVDGKFEEGEGDFAGKYKWKEIQLLNPTKKSQGFPALDTQPTCKGDEPIAPVATKPKTVATEEFPFVQYPIDPAYIKYQMDVMKDCAKECREQVGEGWEALCVAMFTARVSPYYFWARNRPKQQQQDAGEEPAALYQ